MAEMLDLAAPDAETRQAAVDPAWRRSTDGAKHWVPHSGISGTGPRMISVLRVPTMHTFVMIAFPCLAERGRRM